MNDDADWDGARIVLALADTGSLSAAAGKLGLSTSTVSRRLDAIERALGVSLFVRSPEGAVLTRAGEDLLPYARALAQHAMAYQQAATDLERRVAGAVRLGVPPGFVEYYLGAHLHELLTAYPELDLEISTARDLEDLARREADLVIRLERPTQAELISQLLGVADDAVLAAPAYLERLADTADVTWIMWTQDVGTKPATKWLDEHVPASTVRLRFSTITGIVAAVRAGAGVALLPAHLQRAEGLVDAAPYVFARLPAPIPPREIYLVAHQAVRSALRVAAVWEFIASRAAARPFSGGQA